MILYGMMVARKESLPPGRTYRLLVLFVGLTAFSVPYALVYWGQRQIPSALASILFATYPFFVAFFSSIFLPNEKMTLLKFIAIILAFAGVYVIFAGQLALDARIAVGGMAAIVGSSFIQASALVLLKKYGGSFSPISVNFVSMGIGAILLMGASVFAEDYTGVVFTAKAVLSITYLAIFGTVVAFVTYFWLVKHVETVLLSMTSFITPIIAVALGALVLGERLTPQMIIGAGMVLGGILIANAKDVARLAATGKSLLWG
jgi:drug/metabolite transporter (DMT)-like permease